MLQLIRKGWLVVRRLQRALYMFSVRDILLTGLSVATGLDEYLGKKIVLRLPLEVARLKIKRVRCHGCGQNARVSVVIPTYNGMNDGLPELIDSLHRQSLQPFEIIAVDSSSTDGTTEYLRNKGVKVISIPKKAFRHDYARNLGAEHASGGYILFTVQDACFDDPNWLIDAICHMEAFDASSLSSAQRCREDADAYARYLERNFLINNEYENVVTVTCPGRFPRLIYRSIRPGARERLIHVDDTNHLIRKDVFDHLLYRMDTCEDMDLGKRLFFNGHRFIYTTLLSVTHSHRYDDLSRYAKRVFIDMCVIDGILRGSVRIRNGTRKVERIITTGAVLLSNIVNILDIEFNIMQRQANDYTIKDYISISEGLGYLLKEEIGNLYHNERIIQSIPEINQEVQTLLNELGLKLVVPPSSQECNMIAQHMVDHIRNAVNIVSGIGTTFDSNNDFKQFCLLAAINVWMYWLALAFVRHGSRKYKGNEAVLESWVWV